MATVALALVVVALVVVIYLLVRKEDGMKCQFFGQRYLAPDSFFVGCKCFDCPMFGICTEDNNRNWEALTPDEQDEIAFQVWENDNV